MNGDIVSFHSIRRGSGKSTIIANLAALLVKQGRRVVIVETDFNSPSMSLFFGLPENKITLSLTDYIAGKCEITQAIYPVTQYLKTPVSGQLFLLPAMQRVFRAETSSPEAYTFEHISQGLQLIDLAYQPDMILIDNMAGLHDKALLSAAACHIAVVILHTDAQDYQGTAVAVDLARKLNVPHIYLLLNDAPASLDPYQAREQLESIYQCKVIAVIPQSEDIATLASGGLLAFQKPNAPVLEHFRQALAVLINI